MRVEPRIIHTLARVTFLDAVRQRYFNFLLLVAVAFTGSSLFLREFNFGSSELKFIYDLGTGTVLLFGTIVAVLLTTQMIFSELDNHTALTILARPVPRHTFLLGKFLGIWALLWCFVLILCLLLFAILQARYALLMQGHEGGGASAVEGFRRLDVLVFALVQGVRLGVIAALTLFFSTIASSQLFAMVVSFLGIMICQLQYVALESLSGQTGPLYRLAVGGIAVLFPNFHLFNLGDMLVFPMEDAVSAGGVLRILGYGLLYILIYPLLAVFLFRSREL